MFFVCFVGACQQAALQLNELLVEHGIPPAVVGTCMEK
jgi:hypothetical protein